MLRRDLSGHAAYIIVWCRDGVASCCRSHITGYMDDHGKRSAYIAAQCPFDDTTALDTWRMIYQQAVPTVVVLSKVIEDGALRCLQFWPDMGKAERGPFVVSRDFFLRGGSGPIIDSEAELFP